MTSEPQLPWSELVARETDGMRRLARALVYDPGLADDLVQRAWVVALERGEAPRDAGGFLRGVVRMLARNDRRSGARRKAREASAARVEAIEGGQAAVERIDAAARVLGFLRKLDEPYRGVLSERFLEGREPSEIAKLRGVPAATVRTWQARGLEKLRAAIEAEEGERSAAFYAALLPIAGTPPVGFTIPDLGSAASAGGAATPSSIAAALVAMHFKKIAIASFVAALAVGGWQWKNFAVAPESATGAAASRAALVDSDAQAAGVPRSVSVAEPGPVSSRTDVATAPQPQQDAAVQVFVRDQAGHAVAGASVRQILFDEYEHAWSGTGPLHATDAQGQVQLPIEPSAEGWFGALALAEGLCARSELGVWKTDGEPAVLEFVLVPDFVAYGTVTTAAGTPIPNVVVTSFDATGLEARTDERGRYRLANLPPPSYQLQVYAEHPDFAAGQRDAEVGSAREVRIDLMLDEGVQLSGSVTDAEGQALPGVELYAGFSPNAWDAVRAQTDEHGRFTIEHASPWHLELFASAPGYAMTVQPMWTPDQETVEVSAIEGLELVMTTGDQVGGTVLDANGAPIADANVQAELGWTGVAGARTDEAGRFLLESLPAGELMLRVRADGFRVGDRFEARPGDLEHVIQLERAGRLRGRVVSAADGAPVERFTVKVRPAPGTVLMSFETWMAEGREVRSADGVFDLQVPAALGDELIVTVEGPGLGISSPHTIPVVAEQTEPVLIELAGGTRLVGFVVDGMSGAPVRDALVRWKIADVSNGFALARVELDQHRTDANGRFEIANLPAEVVFLEVAHEDFARRNRIPVDLTLAGASHQVTIDLTGGQSLHGRAFDAEGNALRSGRVVLRNLGDTNAKQNQRKIPLDRGGRFSADELQAGEWLAIVEADLNGQHVTRYANIVNLEPGTPTECELRPEGEGRLRVTFVSSLPLPDEIVFQLVPESSSDGQVDLREFGSRVRGGVATGAAWTLDHVHSGIYSVMAGGSVSSGGESFVTRGRATVTVAPTGDTVIEVELGK